MLGGRGLCCRVPVPSSLSPTPQRGISRQRSVNPGFPSLSKPLPAALGHKAITPGVGRHVIPIPFQGY